MGLFVAGFRDIDRTKMELVGGKGANLGELARIDGINVPDGFCVTTEAFKRIMELAPINHLLDRLSELTAGDREEINEWSGEIRGIIEGIAIPRELADEVTEYIQKTGAKNPWAVRSSATAEDLPTSSFAGQQDTYLNIIGIDAVLKHISKCWASLFSERAIVYRLQNGFDHRKVHLSVVVQQMVFPQVAGILFTADPVNGNRKVMSIDASFGLGEAMVSGLVNADNYKVRNGQITETRLATKKLAIYPLPDGGTKTKEIPQEQQNQQALNNEHILELERIGRKIEAHFGSPQDIEWCLADDTVYIVQSRPITTLFPVPARMTLSGGPVANDNENHVYISSGHQQMMTDAMKPLGLSFFQLTARRPIPAGGRLFVDVTLQLASPTSRNALLDLMGEHDPLMKVALMAIIDRGDFIPSLPNGKEPVSLVKSSKGKSAADIRAQTKNDPAIVAELIGRTQTSLAQLQQNIQSKSGSELFDFILEDMEQLKQLITDPQSTAVFMTAIHATSWINEHIQEWLGEKNVADTLTQSAPNNITSEMGRDLQEVADVLRPYPEVVEYLQEAKDDNFSNELAKLDGGHESNKAICAYLSKYGMRCAGEIDITRTRWSEKPLTLAPLILGNIKNFEPDAGKRKFEQGLQEAIRKEQELLERLEQLPDGVLKARETKEMISLVRNFIGYREYPKYGIVSRYYIYKLALLKEAERLVQANVIPEKEDVFYLTFEEFHEVVRTNKSDDKLIMKRKDEYRSNKKLTPPRVITSDGEILNGAYKKEDMPVGAIAGLAVSSGIIEGRARVILNMEDADIEEGDILVTTFTDPSWTPLFVSVKGLVTEVGGMMTHGAVIAREYGLPAVVGVENATKLIRDGQRIRVNGTEGYVEVLEIE